MAEPNFADNEAIRMVDIDGLDASYVPETSAITNVENFSQNDVYLTASSAKGGGQFDDLKELGNNDPTDGPFSGSFTSNGWAWVQVTLPEQIDCSKEDIKVYAYKRNLGELYSILG